MQEFLKIVTKKVFFFFISLLINNSRAYKKEISLMPGLILETRISFHLQYHLAFFVSMPHLSHSGRAFRREIIFSKSNVLIKYTETCSKKMHWLDASTGIPRARIFEIMNPLQSGAVYNF